MRVSSISKCGAAVEANDLAGEVHLFPFDFMQLAPPNACIVRDDCERYEVFRQFRSQTLKQFVFQEALAGEGVFICDGEPRDAFQIDQRWCSMRGRAESRSAVASGVAFFCPIASPDASEP